MNQLTGTGPDDGDLRAAAPLRFRGDWGGVNLTRTCGWLAQWVWHQTPEHRRSVIHTGRGMGDNLRALAAGEVDVAVMTPAGFAQLALRGQVPFADQPMPQLRAIAQLPHRDAMLFAARADAGIRSLSDLATRRLPLRLAIGADDPDGFMGLGARIVLDAAGIAVEDIEAWGGEVRRHEEPFGCLDDLRDGRADAVITEAIMTPQWAHCAEQVRLRFVGLSTGEQQKLAATWRLGCVSVPAGYLPGMTEDVTTLDFGGWLVVTTEHLDDGTTALLARCVATNSAALEAQYRHLPADRSPLAYPVTVAHAAATPIPLHPAAQREYHSARRSP